MTSTDEPQAQAAPKIHAEMKRSATTYTLYVGSTPSDRVTAWHVRDFVRALDTAGIPDNARIEYSSSPERGLTGLRVHHTVELADDEPTTVQAARTSDAATEDREGP